MAIFDPFWAVLGCFGLFWAVLGCFEGVLGSFWGVLGLFWAVWDGLGPNGHFGSLLVPLHVMAWFGLICACRFYASRTNLFQSM